MKTVIAIDLGGTNIRAALITDTGRVVRRRTIPTDPSRTVRRIVEQVTKLVMEIASDAKQRRLSISSVGIGVPGFIADGGEKIVHSPNFLGWKNVRLRAMLTKRLRKKIYLENDANCAALGECWKGKGRGKKDVVFLTLGTGIGGGIISAGQLLRGSNGAAAELGHITVDPAGPLCGCGNRGCLEAMASATAIHRDTGKSPLDLFHLAQKNNSEAVTAFDQVGRILGVGLATISFTLDPDIIILGGQVSGAFDFFVGTLREEYGKRLRNHPARNTRIVRAKLGDDAGLFGAASLVFAVNS